ncbi:nif-specific transcriptional activator NifA [Oharaeibacter diazotrophicus]|uniref:Nif-specific regulatory protein n=1 Tax=Oharaeibacter diazotrophicus TaxID=1920512 RepID=A0A4R6RAU8_9HYPH|nr:nif-specific transcriptional activator NifA [Oharaeibacter diazotrophicus]TDP83114.1 Nif-specific regulatory protein [Oharaeibacter diazotrophicus]BBE71944.1 Nif-specific regulatory protein [Pleomorphomonas sp. SM30]GLS78708.1 nif-specific regulatory protein [Oharaeibacter diazotrophicus]
MTSTSVMSASRPASAAGRPASAGAYREIALSGIYEISKILTSARSLESCLANIVAILSSFMQMRRGMILMLDDSGTPELAAATGPSAAKPMKNGSLVPQKAIDQIVATQVPLVIENVAQHPMFKGSVYLMVAPTKSTMSFIGVPIKADGRVIGTLSIDREWDGRLEFRLEDDVRFLTMIANLIGQTVRLHRRIAEDRDRLIEDKQRLEKALSNVMEEGGASAATTGRPAPAPKTGIVGDSPSLRAVLRMVDQVAPSNVTVLLRGETGTGKEMFAKAIHAKSPRRNGPFVKVNCAALPESVIESELFGHEKGAFTGAVGSRRGRFELAHGGTLFLDEIGEISAAFQAKLLRVLQEGEFERVGGTQTLKADFRLICATNKNLEKAVEQGAFRADLYYRINVVTLMLPALRERPGDIPRLAASFLTSFGAENRRSVRFRDEALDVLARCYFPGNVRELENCVRRTAAMTTGPEIGKDDLACSQGNCLSATLWKGKGARVPAGQSQAAFEPVGGVFLPIAGVAAPASDLPKDCVGADECPAVRPGKSEREMLIDAMERTGWVQAKAARLLNLTPRQIGYALRKQGIELKKL